MCNGLVLDGLAVGKLDHATECVIKQDMESSRGWTGKVLKQRQCRQVAVKQMVVMDSG